MELKHNFLNFQEIENKPCKTIALAKPETINHRLKRKIIVMDKQECVFLKLDDIIYAEAKGAYTYIYLSNGKKMMVCKNIKTFSERLPESEFIRVHKSYIININSIDKYIKSDGGYLILENGDNIPVSVRKRKIVTEFVEQWSV